MKSSRKCICGFSAVEVTIATIVVGILAALTIPQLPRTIENQRVKGAEKTLYEIYCAQKRYFLNHGQYAAALNNLDTAVKTPSGFNISVANNATQLGTFAKNDNSYSLVIDSSGTINCSGNACSSLAVNQATGGTTSPGGNGGSCGNNNGTGGGTGGGDTGGTGNDNGGTTGDDGNAGGNDPGSTGGDDTGGTTVGTDPIIVQDPVNDDPIIVDPEPIVEPDPTQEPTLEETYNQVLKMYSKSPEELAKWIEENPDLWQKLLEQYPDVQELLKENKGETGDQEIPESVKAAYDELMAMFNADPAKVTAWIEENQDAWNELLEYYPGLEEILGKSLPAPYPIR